MDGESWKFAQSVSVRDGESWKSPISIMVRDSESWKVAVPQVVLHVVARKLENLSLDPISGTATLLSGSVVLSGPNSLTLSSTYTTSSFTINADVLARCDPTELVVGVEGSVTVVDILDGASELRVTQVKLEIND